MSLFEGSKDLTIHGGTFIAHRMEPGELTFFTTGGDYFAYLISGALRGFDLLTSKALPSAFHMADADPFHSTCHPNTRTRILEQIQGWANRKIKHDRFILWVHGAAGGGKTAIGRTIAQSFEREGILLGEFFFSRTDGARDHIASLPATLAYRMAIHTLPATKWRSPGLSPAIHISFLRL